MADGERATTLTSAIFETLREGILTGRYAPGEQLKTDPLRAAHSAGLSPVREALNRLVAEGLAVQHDQRGFFVTQVHPDELADITEVRCLIGEAALRASIHNGDAAWEERVVVAHRRLDRQLAPPRGETTDFRARSTSHRAFHTALLDACGSRWLLNFWHVLFDQAHRYQALFLDGGAGERDPRVEHRELMDAVLMRDEDRAIALHDAHIRFTQERVLMTLANSDRPSATAAE